MKILLILIHLILRLVHGQSAPEHPCTSIAQADAITMSAPCKSP